MLNLYNFSSITNQTNNSNNYDLSIKCTILTLNKGFTPYICYMLHIVGCLCYDMSDVRSHNHQNLRLKLPSALYESSSHRTIPVTAIKPFGPGAVHLNCSTPFM